MREIVGVRIDVGDAARTRLSLDGRQEQEDCRRPDRGQGLLGAIRTSVVNQGVADLGPLAWAELASVTLYREL